MADFKDEFYNEILRLRRLTEELNGVMKASGSPMSRQEQLELAAQIDALEHLGGFVKSDEEIYGVVSMVKLANTAIESMLKDLTYVGPEKLIALEDDEDLQEILEFFNVERDSLPKPPKMRQEKFFDDNGEEFDMYYEEEDNSIEDTPIAFDTLIQRPQEPKKYDYIGSEDGKKGKAPKDLSNDELLRKLMGLDDDDENER